MTATCHPITQTAAREMLQGVVFAICDRPGETMAQREARAHEVVLSVMAFKPRDPVEIMLAGMAVAHYHLIMDSTHDAFGEPTDIPRGRGNAGVVGLDRALTGFLKEIRIAQTRPLEDAAEPPRRDAPVEADATQPPKRAAEVQPPSAAPTAQRTPTPSWEDAAPAGLLPPLRHTEASILAMMAVLSPPTQPFVIDAGKQQADKAAAPRAGPAVRAPPPGAREDGFAAIPGTLNDRLEPVAGPADAKVDGQGIGRFGTVVPPHT